ncbi:MAG: arginine--tRNA ligase [Bacteroidota bacterium]
MNIEHDLKIKIAEALYALYNITISPESIQLTETRKEFEGDFTLVVFPFIKESRLSPEETGKSIGEYITNNFNTLANFNVVKGFLNLGLSDGQWMEYFNEVGYLNKFILKVKGNDSIVKNVMVEYSSPNTNKPLHLGHVRNNLLGYSVAEILKEAGNSVKKANLINDRGIHICKSMLAWQRWGNGETPDSSGLKGDHLVGKYYVKFDKEYKKEIEELMKNGLNEDEAKKQAPVIIDAQEMLLKWEQGDSSVMELWKTMNGWVYEGFDATYKKLGVDFDKIYYESQTYLLGKAIVEEGLQKGIFYKKEDGSVWVDLTEDGLDEKLLLRGDGTSVYITQDLGTAALRFEEYPNLDQLIYVVGNEQEYHFKVLKLIFKKLGKPWWDGLYHLSYGMVNLPSGKMKSREGTVVDADELIEEMVNTSRDTTLALGKVEDFTMEQAEKLFYKLGMGALKYYILKVDAKKTMLFNPAESIDFNGNTGPFIQYTYARICSVIRKAEKLDGLKSFRQQSVLLDRPMMQKEKDILRHVFQFSNIVHAAATELSPSIVANYVYELAKLFNTFYHDCPIADAEKVNTSLFRLQLSNIAGQTIKECMRLMGIKVPEQM